MVCNSQNTKFLRLTSWKYVFNVTQTSVNKQRYWMDLTLARSNDAFVGVAEIDVFMKVWTTPQM